MPTTTSANTPLIEKVTVHADLSTANMPCSYFFRASSKGVIALLSDLDADPQFNTLQRL
jgi:hypothetical protein